MIASERASARDSIRKSSRPSEHLDSSLAEAEYRHTPYKKIGENGNEVTPTEGRTCGTNDGCIIF